MQIRCEEKNQIYLMRSRQDETKGENVALLCILRYIRLQSNFSIWGLAVCAWRALSLDPLLDNAILSAHANLFKLACIKSLLIGLSYYKTQVLLHGESALCVYAWCTSITASYKCLSLGHLCTSAGTMLLLFSAAFCAGMHPFLDLTRLLKTYTASCVRGSQCPSLFFVGNVGAQEF